ncbi:MAG: hypothetical protein ABJG96_03080, partial [Paracoccaceae bacterium]
ADCVEKLFAATANFLKLERCSPFTQTGQEISKKILQFRILFCQICPKFSILEFFNTIHMV